MPIGKMRYRVELQEETGSVQNSYGEKVPVFTTQAVRWASIQVVAGQEYFDGNRLQANISLEVVIRFYFGLKPKWRLRLPPAKAGDSERFFNIEAVMDEDQKRVWHHLKCKEVIV